MMKKFKKISTINGSISTPVFMPDATRGVLKLLNNSEIKKTGIKAMVVNTFHLYLQPGIKIIKKAGGIHKFMGWKGPLLSDSGGYQIFSLIHKNREMGKILDDRVVFKSPIDGSRHELSPEKSIQIQFDLGVDMMVCLDDCPPNGISREKLKNSIEKTIFWAKKCKDEYERQIRRRKIKNKKPPLFAVIQGGEDFELREYCARELVKIGFDGYGFGGRHYDSHGNFMGKMLELTASLIPAEKLKFALGIGTPEDIKNCVQMGWQFFDCVIPTREGRHGRLFFFKKSKNGIKSTKNFYFQININNSKFKNNFTVINSKSNFNELRVYSKAYLHHLFKINDPLGQRLASLHNLEFYANLLKT